MKDDADRAAARSMTIARLIASGFGAGYAPVAPGTAASAAAVLAGGRLMLGPAGTLMAASATAALGGLWAIRATRVEGDPGWVVIDEIAGQWVTLLGLRRLSVPGLFAAFALFRLLDIVKPGPVAWADRRKDAVGIMADDVIAGVIGAGILWALRTRLQRLL